MLLSDDIGGRSNTATRRATERPKSSGATLISEPGAGSEPRADSERGAGSDKPEAGSGVAAAPRGRSSLARSVSVGSSARLGGLPEDPDERLLDGDPPWRSSTSRAPAAFFTNLCRAVAAVAGVLAGAGDRGCRACLAPSILIADRTKSSLPRADNCGDELLLPPAVDVDKPLTTPAGDGVASVTSPGTVSSRDSRTCALGVAYFGCAAAAAVADAAAVDPVFPSSRITITAMFV